MTNPSDPKPKAPAAKPPAPPVSGGPRPPVVPVPPPEKERPVTPQSQQVCQKCGAEFRWERGNPDQPRSPLRLTLLKGSQRCDCGYGRPRGKQGAPK